MNKSQIQLISSLMKEKSISIPAMATMCGISHMTIRRILKDETYNPTSDTIRKIADALDITASQLMQDDVSCEIDLGVNGFIEYNGEIQKINSLAALQKLVSNIVYETKELPKEAKAIIAANKANREIIKKGNPNEHYNFNLDWDSIDNYDATKYDCWGFKTADDEKDGMLLDFGNQCSGYPFIFHGHKFHSSESAYLCGQFSLNTEECKQIQNQLLYERNGYTAKKKVKNANRQLIRSDWKEFMADWMLYVIWTKCKENKDFADKLKALPRNAIIMENSTTIHEGTSILWGSKNEELEDAREKVARYTELEYMNKVKQGKIRKDKSELEAQIQKAINDIHYIGTYSGGHNYMGKILKRCQLALLDGKEPMINYQLLRGKQIYLFGELLTFDDEAYKHQPKKIKKQ